MQDTEWREKFDWIHRNSNGELLLPIKAIKHCLTRNIRPQTDGLGFSIKKFYDTELMENLEKMKTVQPDAMLLKTVNC